MGVVCRPIVQVVDAVKQADGTSIVTFEQIKGGAGVSPGAVVLGNSFTLSGLTGDFQIGQKFPIALDSSASADAAQPAEKEPPVGGGPIL